METLNHVRKQLLYSWPFMNAIDTGGGSYFTSQCIRRQTKTQGKPGSELDLKRENSSSARRTKTAPESCFENSFKFRENEKLQALRN